MDNYEFLTKKIDGKAGIEVVCRKLLEDGLYCTVAMRAFDSEEITEDIKKHMVYTCEKAIRDRNKEVVRTPNVCTSCEG